MGIHFRAQPANISSKQGRAHNGRREGKRADSVRSRSVGACMISCRPRTPKRDNVINIVDVGRSSSLVLFCRRNAAKSRFFSLEGQIESNPDPFRRFSGAFLIRRIFPDQKVEEFSPNSRHNGGFKTRIPRRLWNLTENGTFGDI